MLNRRMLPGELREFACDNRLRTGDLLFEQTTKERLAMSVRIIRSEQYS
jgi:hypothetical protein